MRTVMSCRALLESMGAGGRGLAGLVAAASLGAAGSAGAISVSWDDAGGSASKLWSDFGNWSPDGDVANDDVFIGNLAAAAGDATLLDSAKTIASLTINGGASVTNSTDGGATNDFELIVNGLTTLGSGGTGGTLFVIGNDGDGLDTQGLTINTAGVLNLNSTTAQGTAVVEIESGLLSLGTGGTIIGQGRIDFEDPAAAVTTVFTNNGTLTANTPTTFFFTAPAAGTLLLNDGGNANRRFDWDGGGNAVININGNQTLDVDISTGTDAWSGEMNLSTGSTLDMRDAWSMDSGTINVNTAAFGLIIIGQDPFPGAPAVIAGADWTMTGGTITIDDAWDSLQLDSQLIASGGVINNNGTMIFNGGATIQAGVDFNMVAGNDSGASLIINSTVNISTPDFNLDGQGLAGNVTTINVGGNLDLNLGAGADEDFDHTINMNGGELDVTTLDNGWSLTTNGNLNAAGGANSTINGETFTVNGGITTSGSGTFLDINAPTIYNAGASVVVGADTIYNHDAAVTYNGGSYTGTGTFRKGTATIAASTNWNVATVDLDDGTTTINDGATLTINTDSIDDTGDGIDSSITIADTGVLSFNLSGGASVLFDPAGSINYNGNATSNTFLTGSTIQMNGTMNITGDGTSTARIILGSTGTINLNTLNEPLRFDGGDLVTTNRIEGGTITGIGHVGLSFGHALVGFGTIDSDIQFFNSGNRIAADDGILNINSAFVGVGGSTGTDDADGILNVTNAWNTNSFINVRLQGGEIRGNTITNDATEGIIGNGLLAARVINNTQIAAQSGTLIVQTALNNNDWDGTTNTGTLRAQTGDLELRDNAAFLFTGTVRVDGGREVFANGFELEFDPGSTLQLNGNATYRSTNATDIGGSLTSSGSQNRLNIAGTTSFESTSSSTINSNLLLDNAVTNIASGATFNGAGRLINAPGRTLRLFNNANVGVLVENRGDLDLGSGVGIARGDVLDYVQTAAGTTHIDLGGTGIGQFDRLFVSGNAQLEGELDLDVVGGYVPTLMDQFTVINSAGLIGTFDTIDGVLFAPGQALAVTYTATSVVVTVALPGDTNLDGDVDDSDLGTSFANYTGPIGAAGGKTWVTGDTDGDGDVDDSDLGTSLAGYTGPLSPASVPEPASLALIGMGGLMLVRRRRQA